MKSRVSIDVDHDNQPVIKIEYSPSEDVRDKLVKKFLESFGGESAWTSFYFINQGESTAVHGQSNSTALIRPIPLINLSDEIKAIEVVADRHAAMLKSVTEPKE